MKLRNIAIIAHVDHGKTTLIDQMLKQSGVFRENQHISERILDSNELEKERGITIIAKATSVVWNNTRINIIDTPGHADFGGEVECILSMVDGAILLVDAAEGPMPQTKFVVKKALKSGLCPIVIINKIDRSDSRSNEVINEVFDLFMDLNANDQQLDFPILYGSGREGWMKNKETELKNDGFSSLFELIIKHVPEPKIFEGSFRMIGTILDNDPFLGRIITGRIYSGRIRPNQMVKVLSKKGDIVESNRVSKVLAFRGVERKAIEEGVSGDIISITNFQKGTIADTFCDPDVVDPLNAPSIDPPTVTMTFLVNDSPLSGTEGKKITSRMIRDRLFKEASGNASIIVQESKDKDSFYVSGRGELQLAILIEKMRREGFEIGVSRPRVVTKKIKNNEILEPIEEVIIDVDQEYSGNILQKLSKRKGEILELKSFGKNRSRMVFHIPTRGLIGYQNEFLTDTKGTGIINRSYFNYQTFKGSIVGRTNGVMISNDIGESVAYSLFNLQDRGSLIINVGTKVYKGMIVGIHSRSNDLEVNVIKNKKLTNVRASGKDDAIKLIPSIPMTLEKAISWIQDDELVEVTPKAIRLRKRYLNYQDRKKFGKNYKDF